MNEIFEHFHMPFEDPVLIFALVMLLILVAPLLISKLRIPSLIGLIAAGALVGPNALGLLERDPTIILLGTVGILYLMFMAGLEIDLNEFGKAKNRAIVFGIITFSLPQGLGIFIGLGLGYEMLSSILLASIFASHTLLAYPIASRLRITKNPAVITAVGGTIITDVAALLVLAVVAGASQGELDATFWIRLGVALAIYVSLVLFVLPRIGRWFFRRSEGEGATEFIFVMAALFTCSFLAEVAGVEAIIGAFLAGLALNRLIPHQGTLSNRIHFVGNALFIPFFLISVGMLVDVGVLLRDKHVWIVAGSMNAAVVITKFVAAKLTQVIFKYSPAEGWTIFGLSVPQAAATLAATLVGFDLGLFDQATVNGVIVMILVTCIIGPFVVEKYGQVMALQEAQRPVNVTEAPQRILIPLMENADNEALLDLAFLLRQPGSLEPLFPLTVVPSGEDATAKVAAAEKLLLNAVEYASGAEVSVVPLTRVALNPAVGVVRAITEQRISDVVMCWDGTVSHSRRLFGHVIDPVVQQEGQQLWLCHLDHPLATTTRVVVVLPPNIDKNAGFYDALRGVKSLSSQLGALLTVVALNPDLEHIQGLVEEVKPDVPLSFVGYDRFPELLESLHKRLQPNDFPIFLSARRGTIAYSDDLARLPRSIKNRVPQSFAIVYPPEREDAGVLQPTARQREAASVRIEPEHVWLDLPEMSLHEATRTLLLRVFVDDPDRAHKLATSLPPETKLVASEVIPGIRLVPVRSGAVERELLLLGVSTEGFVLPDKPDEQIQAILVVVAPEAEPLDVHLRRLSIIGRHVTKRGNLEGLLSVRT